MNRVRVAPGCAPAPANITKAHGGTPTEKAANLYPFCARRPGRTVTSSSLPPSAAFCARRAERTRAPPLPPERRRRQAAFLFRRFRACGHIHRHSGRLPQPSFRPAPPTVIPAGSPNRHSGESRNLCPAVTFTVIPAPPTVIPAGSPSRHSGASRNLCPAVTFTVIPAPPTVIPAGSPSRHSGASRNLCPAVTFTVIPDPPAVIPAQAGIYACRLHYRSSRLRRWIPAQAGMTVAGASQC